MASDRIRLQLRAQSAGVRFSYTSRGGEVSTVTRRGVYVCRRASYIQVLKLARRLAARAGHNTIYTDNGAIIQFGAR